MKSLAFALCVLLSPVAYGQDSGKQQLASQFYDATTAKQIDAITRSAANAILKKDPKKVRQAEIYRQWANESFGSADYKNIYVQFLVDNFSAEELLAMNQWAKNPLFLGYMNKWQMFPQWSAKKFQEFLKVRNSELARRLRAEGFDPSN